MVEFRTRKSDTEIEGCLLAVDAVIRDVDELTIEDIEDIDDVMRNLGVEQTGRRLEVDSKPDMTISRVKYVYQETINSKSFANLEDLFGVKTRFDDYYFVVGTEIVELVE